jgi:prepilin-type processing-associated H-X9-DG protein
MSIAMSFYTDDNEGTYRQHGYAGVFLHCMRDKWQWREDYLENDPRPMYCPSADLRYNHTNPYNGRAMGYVGGNADDYFGFAYWGGDGLHADDTFAPTNWSKGKSKYTPTLSLRYGEDKGNPEQRPIFSDLAGLTGTRVRQEQGSDTAFPSNNHQLNGNYLMSAWMNIVFMDGHAVGVGAPHSGGYPLRVNHERPEVGDYYW